MDKSVRLQLQDFFEQFTKLSERAEKHWPLPKSIKESDENVDISYEFVQIITKKRYYEELPLIDSFFRLYQDEACIFSQGKHITSEDIVKEQIPAYKELKKSRGCQMSGDICTFLLIGYEIGTTEARVGCIGHYFPASRTILIESIVVASELLGEEKQIIPESGDPSEIDWLKEKQLDYEEKQQIVLSWLLTYRQQQKGGKKAALYRLIDELEKTIAVTPINSENSSSLSLNNVVLGVFHEALNPVLADSVERKGAVKALLTFHKVDARFLRFAYRHPSHPSMRDNRNANYDKDAVDNRKYFLLTFPQVLKTPNWLAIESGVIMAFIVDYGYHLYQPYPYYKKDLNACWNFKPGKKTSITGFVDGSNNDAISLNYKSIFENRLSEHATVLYLHNIPRLEQPRFSYKRASVGFEIMVDEDYFEPIGLNPYHDMTPPAAERTKFGRAWDIIREEWKLRESPKPIALYCPVAHSGETDLFSYKYQSNPPYFTRYYEIPSNKVTVHFPSHFEFTSEGRVETFYRLPDIDESDPSPILTDKKTSKDSPIPHFTYSVSMTACVSYTYFLNSRIRIWHLVLKPDPESQQHITELEIIKLMRFFSGSQEHESEEDRRRVMRQVKFSVNGALNLPNETDEVDEQIDRNSFHFSLKECFPFPYFLPNKTDQTNWERTFRKLTWVCRQTLYSFFTWWWWLLRGLWRTSIRLARLISVVVKGRLYKKELSEEMPWLNKPDNLIQLLQDLTGVKYVLNENTKMDRLRERADQVVSLRNVRSGVVEVDTGDVGFATDGVENRETSDLNSFLGFYEDPDAPHLDLDKRNDIRKKVIELYENLHNDEIQMGDEPESFSVEEYADYVFKSYCGICLGIFDYDRMGFQEIDDTLVPLPDSKTETSFMVIHRGVLAMLGHGDDVLDTFWNTLGINAYLLIPSAVLAHNDIVSRDAEDRLTFLLNSLRQGNSSLSIAELIHQRNVIDDLLNDDVLGDVFQYKTEQELYKEGMQRRGIAERVKDGKAKLDQLDKLINTMQEERSARAQKFIQIFAAIFSLTSLYTPLRDLYVDEMDYNGSKRNVRITWELELVWEKIKNFFASFWDPKWIFPENALAAAHHQISLIIAIVLLYSLVSWLFSPGSNVIKFWQRSRRSKRNLPYIHTSSGKRQGKR